jgi:hypothetical protein
MKGETTGVDAADAATTRVVLPLEGGDGAKNLRLLAVGLLGR